MADETRSGERLGSATVLESGAFAQLATLAGVGAGIALAFNLRLDPGMAMLAATASVLAAWLLADGVPVLLRLLRRNVRRNETRRAFWIRVATKMAGLWALGGLAFVACLAFPFFVESRVGEWLLSAPDAMVEGVILLVPFAVLYVALTDRLSEEPDDYLHQVGRAILMQDYREAEIFFALRVLAIKSFFFVLMFSGGMASFAWFADNPFADRPPLSAAWFEALIRAVYLIDVVLAAGGYLATLKLFGWHIRATETTVSGWVVCLLCYEPFFPAVSCTFVPYEDGPGWQSVLAEGSAFFILWSAAVLFCHLVYVWATVAFGPRFSNLTHRGIITGGPYRFTKHPAYLAKNAAWWLFSLPGFLASGFPEGMFRAGMLAIISFIYLQRARAEERMLGADPAYRAYAETVAAHGLFGAVRRLLAGRAA